MPGRWSPEAVGAWDWPSASNTSGQAQNAISRAGLAVLPWRARMRWYQPGLCSRAAMLSRLVRQFKTACVRSLDVCHRNRRHRRGCNSAEANCCARSSQRGAETERKQGRPPI
ncbi:hypothetical protein TRVL_07061 [Trypanosoma vivax]|nr:hypothetical protein TRVL_07061 [Trypanosoma vivax]